jgi:hypothetical protein
LATLYDEDEQAVIRSGKPLLAREEECRDPAGNLMHLETTKIPLRDAAGTVEGDLTSADPLRGSTCEA